MALIAPPLWSPSADEGAVRAAAGQWRAFAVRVACASDELAAAALLVTDGHEGRAVDAFSASWDRLVGPGQRHLTELVAACRSLADALDAYADELARVRRELLELGASIAASLAAGAALAWATAGISAAGAGGTVAALTLEAASLSATLASRSAAIAKLVGLHAGIGALEGLATYAIVEPVMVATFSPNEDPFGAYTWEGAAIAATTGAVLPGWRGLRDLRQGPHGIVARSSWVEPPALDQHTRDLLVDLGVEAGVATWEHGRARDGR